MHEYQTNWIVPDLELVLDRWRPNLQLKLVSGRLTCGHGECPTQPWWVPDLQLVRASFAPGEDQAHN